MKGLGNQRDGINVGARVCHDRLRTMLVKRSCTEHTSKKGKPFETLLLLRVRGVNVDGVRLTLEDKGLRCTSFACRQGEMCRCSICHLQKYHCCFPSIPLHFASHLKWSRGVTQKYHVKGVWNLVVHTQTYSTSGWTLGPRSVVPLEHQPFHRGRLVLRNDVLELYAGVPCLEQ